jgi:hypothetical protein
MKQFRLIRIIKAPLETVWDAADFTKSAGPFPMEVLREGDLSLYGVGFLRAVDSGGKKVLEQLEAVDPPHSYTYTLVGGAPVKKGYLGKVEFTPVEGGTQITWSGKFSPKVWGTGWLAAIVIKKTVGKIIDAVETECLRETENSKKGTRASDSV